LRHYGITDIEETDRSQTLDVTVAESYVPLPAVALLHCLNRGIFSGQTTYCCAVASCKNHACIETRISKNRWRTRWSIRRHSRIAHGDHIAGSHHLIFTCWPPTDQSAGPRAIKPTAVYIRRTIKIVAVTSSPWPRVRKHAANSVVAGTGVDAGSWPQVRNARG